MELRFGSKKILWIASLKSWAALAQTIPRYGEEDQNNVNMVRTDGDKYVPDW